MQILTLLVIQIDANTHIDIHPLDTNKAIFVWVLYSF